MQRGDIAARGITKLDMFEGERATGGNGQRDRLGRRTDLGFFVEQFGQPLGRARCAEQVAIHLGQGGKGTRHQPGGEDERGQRSSRQPSRRDIGEGRPH